MKVYDATSIRNVAVVGHGGCGKTQLISAVLFASGMVNRLGRVDDGTTVTDYDPEAIARAHTLSTSLAFAEWRKTKINLLDTPGVGNFFADASAALQVADAALVVVDGVAGAAVQTEKAWATAEGFGLPRIVVVNRLDRDRASMTRALESLRRACSPRIVPVHLPIGEGDACRGIVDLVGMKTFTAPPEGGAAVEGPVPDAMASEVAAARMALLEMVAETDETLLERFLDAGTLSDHDLVTGLQRATATGMIFPLVCASALRNVGIEPLLNAVLSWLPAAADRPFMALDAAGAAIRRPVDAAAPAAAFVWKSVADQFAGRITVFRVWQGVVTADATIRNATRNADERLGSVALMQGKTQVAVAEVQAGDIGAVAKLKDTHTGDTLADPRAGLRFAALTFPVLEHHGLNRCPDKGLRGLKEYVGLSVLAYNLHILGNYLIAIERKKQGRLGLQRERYRQAA